MAMPPMNNMKAMAGQAAGRFAEAAPRMAGRIAQAAPQMASRLASMGRGPDNTLVHMTGNEVRGLAQRAGGMLPRNPQTGLPEAAVLDDELGAGPVVLFTVMDNGDGTVSLIQGDEPEQMEEMAEGEMPPGAMPPAGPEAAMAGMGAAPGAPPPAPGAAPPPPGPAAAPPGMEMGAPGEEMGEAAPAGDVYTNETLGEMLRQIMDGCVQVMGGQTAGMEEQDMVDAYNGGATPTPA